jgi:ABC-type branched-subunit amino acid transport system ATPase component
MRQILVIENLHTYYGASHVLQGISCALENGLLAIVGRNGMGKTTLVRSIMGLVPASAGRILLRGEDITNLKPYEIASRGVGYIPQGRELFPSLNVDEHLVLVSREGGAWNRDRIYALFPNLRKHANTRAMQLSGGEQQMLTIGRALMTNPSLLIMDEPSEGLAPIVLKSLVETFGHLTETGISIVLIEQNLRFATSLAKELYVMVTGRIVQKIDSQTILHDRKVQERLLGVSVHS